MEGLAAWVNVGPQGFAPCSRLIDHSRFEDLVR